MIKFLITFLLIPLFSSAQQRRIPRFENDTLYTITGYRIYNGIKLKFGAGVRNRMGSFKYINIKSDQASNVLVGNSFIIKRMLNFGVSQLNNTYIEIKGQVIYKDGSTGGVDLHIAIDSAISTGEIIMPEDQVAVIPVTSDAHKNLPRLDNDTLYTISGPKIYPGLVIQFGNGTGRKGAFRYISFMSVGTIPGISNTTAVVKKLSHFGINDLNESFIEMLATINFKDGSNGSLSMRISFEHAMAAAELIVTNDKQQ